MTTFVENNVSFFIIWFNIYGDNMNHIERIFNSMIEDIKYIKLATYFKNINK